LGKVGIRELIVVLGAFAAFAPPALSAELTGTLKTIASTGTIKIGFRKDEPPMSFVNNAGEPSGYSIDLCKAVGAEVARIIGKKTLSIEYVPVTSSDRFESVAKGRIDILCEATTKTLKRAEIVDFTQLTFITGGALLSRADAGVPTIAQLEGGKVAVVKSTTTIVALKQALNTSFVKAEIVPVATAVDGMNAMLNGEVAAFASDQIVLIGMIRSVKDGSKSLFLSQELFSREPFALAVRRNDSDFRLAADRALSQLYRSRRIEAIYQKWFPGLKPPVLLRAMYDLNATAD